MTDNPLDNQNRNIKTGNYIEGDAINSNIAGADINTNNNSRTQSLNGNLNHSVANFGDNNVINNQYGIPQKVVDRLLKELDDRDVKLQERDVFISNWIQKHKNDNKLEKAEQSIDQTLIGQGTERKWVWFSTPDSFALSQVSILETMLVSFIYLSIAFKFGTAHLTTAVLLAPIFLLRTDESVKFALEHSRSYEKKAIKNIILPNIKQQITFVFKKLIMTFLMLCLILFAIGYFIILFPSSSSIFRHTGIGDMVLFSSIIGIFVGIYIYTKSILIRGYATTRFILINPSKSISSIPINWWDQIACLDTLHPPEVIPGIIKYESTKNYTSKLQPFGYLYAYFISNPSLFVNNMYNEINKKFMNIFLFFITSLLTYFYRWSMKGTAILMLPMIWLLHDSKTTKPEHIKNSLIMNGVFRSSCFILLCTVIILILRFFEIEIGISEPIQKYLIINDIHGIVNKAFPENKILLWQIFLISTAFLTFCSHLYADRLVNRGYSIETLCWFRRLLSTIGISAVCLIFSLVYLSASIAQFG